MHPCAARPLSSVHQFRPQRLIAMFLVVMASLPAMANGNATTHNGATAPTIAWTRLLGSSGIDISTGVTADGLGNVYISGYTGNSLEGNPWGGSLDAYVSMFSVDGTLAWTRQLGTIDIDVSTGVSADGLGNVYITGYTKGNLHGNTSAGGVDAFISMYAQDGSHVWTEQLGTSGGELPGAIGGDSGEGVIADGLGNVYITGETFGALDGQTSAGHYDAFVSKYTEGGNLAWTQQLGTSGRDSGRSITADGLGNIYITGYTEGALDDNANAGALDAFLSKYNQDGSLAWTQQLGTSHYDQSFDVSADGRGNVYISGQTKGVLEGSTNAGFEDAFVSKYTEDGSHAWTRQLGTSGRDTSHGVTADWLGNVYIVGYTEGALDGNTSAGGEDIFISKYTEDGTLAWTQLLGTAGTDLGLGVTADGLGNVYISGYTQGNLNGNFNAGLADAFLIKLHDPDAVAIDGDITGDGFVGAEDLDVLLANWGASVGVNAIAVGDLSRDGIVGQDDLNIVITNWGNGTPPTSVPEPGTLAMLGLCGFALLRRR